MTTKTTYVQVWTCDTCQFTYKSPIRLSTPPTHRCGGSTLASKNLPLTLKCTCSSAFVDPRCAKHGAHEYHGAPS